jgi:hypothetical protein
MEGMSTPAAPGDGVGRRAVRTVSGVVVDDVGRPLAEAAVAFADSPVPVPDVAVLTGADGRFVLAAPGPGAYTVAVNAPGYPAATADLRVEPGEGTDVQVEISVAPQDRGPAPGESEEP